MQLQNQLFVHNFVINLQLFYSLPYMDHVGILIRNIGTILDRRIYMNNLLLAHNNVNIDLDNMDDLVVNEIATYTKNIDIDFSQIKNYKVMIETHWPGDASDTPMILELTILLDEFISVSDKKCIA